MIAVVAVLHDVHFIEVNTHGGGACSSISKYIEAGPFTPAYSRENPPSFRRS
jgi:hypothetical protein